jgi:D-glycero-D-manno-heptose 1,7-bisphosphate phosphatase
MVTYMSDYDKVQKVLLKHPKNRAVFLDRDGVINELIYYPEHSIVDSPFTPKQFTQLTHVAQAVNDFHRLGFKVVVASNQPCIAKGHISREMFERMRTKMKEDLAKEGAFLDGEYYCFHHPEAKVGELRKNCECRKPKPGLILQAASELDIDLCQSWMIGDGLTDLKAGESAGCRTILIGRMKCELCHLMDEMNVRPDFIAYNLLEAARAVAGTLSSRYELDTCYLKSPV